jgi:hypothetical protein
MLLMMMLLHEWTASFSHKDLLVRKRPVPVEKEGEERRMYMIIEVMVIEER